MRRNFIDYCILILKGMAMGAADLVPGVSGGTMAFISGIYEELICSLGSFRISLIKDLKTNGLQEVWKKINGNFLMAIFGGISISLLTLSKLAAWLIEEKPIELWSFFFGLVLASIVFMLKKINHWEFETILGFVVGTAIAYSLTTWGIFNGSQGLFYMFFSGAIAICAMILPGISGAFILILLGSYHTLLEAISSQNLVTILVFLLGAIVGILSFSKFLRWLFENHKNTALATLTGFMTGAIAKLWPWKTVLSYRLNSKGVQVPLLEECVLPSAFEGDAKIFTAISLMVFGFVLILILEQIGYKLKTSA